MPNGKHPDHYPVPGGGAQTLFCALVLLAGSGCNVSLPRWNTDRWLGDFDTAEERARESGHELLICYADFRRGADPPMTTALASEPLKEMVADKVRCTLSKSYEPDRRYVAQFGVPHAPALILVHRDGTYHAHTGPMTSDRIAEFLTTAQPPGAIPTINRHILRRPRYHWHDSFAAGKAEADRAGQPMLTVYYRTLSRDWQRLEQLLRRHEVYVRLADTVHCRVGLSGLSRDVAITRFGSLRLPALVIVRRNSEYGVLELPTSYEAVVHFADAVLRDDRPNHTDSATSSSGVHTSSP